MSKKRPTEMSWDSDDDLLQDDISGINAFPQSKREEAEEELDEDALLGSDDDEGVENPAEDTTHIETDVKDTGDSSNVGNNTTTFDASEEDVYELVEVSGADDVGEDVIELEAEADSSLLIDSQDEADQVEESYNYSNEAEEDSSMAGFDTTADSTQGMDTTEDQYEGGGGGEEDDQGGSSSDSDSDEEGGRARFKSERSGIVSLSQSKSRTDIPDTLEISEEQQAKIDEFLTKDGRRKARGGYTRGPMGRQQQRQQHQRPPQRQQTGGREGFNSHRPARHPGPHQMQGGLGPRTHEPGQHGDQQFTTGPEHQPPSHQSPMSTGQPQKRKILINPHFRGRAPMSGPSDTTVTWSHQNSGPTQPPRVPQVGQPPTFSAPASHPAFQAQPQSHFNRQPQAGPPVYSRPVLDHQPPGLMDLQPGFNQAPPQQQQHFSGPPYPADEPIKQGPFPGFSPQGAHIAQGAHSQPSFTSRPPLQYGQSRGPPAHGHTAPHLQPQSLLGSPSTRPMAVPHGRSNHHPQPGPGLLSIPHQGAGFGPVHHASQPNERQPFFSSLPNQPFRHNRPHVPQNVTTQNHGRQHFPNQGFAHGVQFQSPPRQHHQLNQPRDSPIQFGFLSTPHGLPNQPNQQQPLLMNPSQQVGRPPHFPQQQHQQRMGKPLQTSHLQNRGQRFPQSQGPQSQTTQRAGRPGFQSPGQTQSGNNITLVNAAPQKRLSVDVPSNISPPKIARTQARRNVRDRLQLPNQNSTKTSTELHQTAPQKQPNTKPTPATHQPKEEEPMDEETRILQQKIEEQKRLREEVIRRKEARRLEQAKQKRLELQKKLAEQGLTLSDVEGPSDSLAPPKTKLVPQNVQPKQQNAPQKKFVLKKVSPNQQKQSQGQGQFFAVKRQGPNQGQIRALSQEPLANVAAPLSQPQGQFGHQDISQGQQIGNPGQMQMTGQPIFNRQNSFGRGRFVRGKRGGVRGGAVRQLSGTGGQTLKQTPAQNQLRQVKLHGQQSSMGNQAVNRNVMAPSEQHNMGANHGGNESQGQGQMGRGQGQIKRGQGNVRGRGQPVRRGAYQQPNRGRGQPLVRQVSDGKASGGRTVVARNMSGNNIVLGGGGTSQDSTNQGANRRVVVGPVKTSTSQFVSVDNLSTSTTQQKLMKMCHSVGPIENIQLLKSQNKAIIKFHNPEHAFLFAQKFDRHLLDLSHITVSTLPS